MADKKEAKETAEGACDARETLEASADFPVAYTTGQGRQ